MEATTATRTLRGHTIGAIDTGAAIIGDNVGAELTALPPFLKRFVSVELPRWHGSGAQRILGGGS